MSDKAGVPLMSVYKGSRYVETPVYVRDGKIAMLELRGRQSFDLTNAVYYTFLEGDTIDGIAYRQYGNAQLYWAILDVNKQYQSELDIKAGDILVIPPLEEVVKHIG